MTRTGGTLLLQEWNACVSQCFESGSHGHARGDVHGPDDPLVNAISLHNLIFTERSGQLNDPGEIVNHLQLGFSRWPFEQALHVFFEHVQAAVLRHSFDEVAAEDQVIERFPIEGEPFIARQARRYSAEDHRLEIHTLGFQLLDRFLQRKDFFHVGLEPGFDEVSDLFSLKFYKTTEFLFDHDIFELVVQ